MKEKKQQQELTSRECRRKRRLKNQIISYIISAFLFVLVLVGIFFGVKYLLNNVQNSEKQKLAEEQSASQEGETTEPIEEPTQATEESTAVLPEEELLEELITTYIGEMTLEEKVAGLFFIEPEAITGVTAAVKAGDGTKEGLAKFPVGGMVYFSKNIQTKAQLQELIKNTVSYSKYPLFIGVDEEGGSVSRLADSNLGIDKMPSMKEIGNEGNVEKATLTAQTIGAYLSEYGFNVDFAPVGDVLTNEKNPIGDRSFSSDPKIAADMVTAFVGGLQGSGVSACVKHFPGHGDTKEDSHNELAVTQKTLEEMRTTEFLPFQAGITANTDFVMVGHIGAPKVIGDDTPSDLSSMMVTEILRNELGYQGIVITDAMNMKAITAKYSSKDAAVLALQAGVDMILMPENFEEAYTGVLDAVKEGKLTEERLNESIRRIYRVKYKAALEEAK